MKFFGKYRMPLNEVTRWEIIRRSQREAPVRFQKKANYRAKDFNNVDFKDLFENDNFTWSSRVGDYIVTISFEGAFDLLQFQLKSMRGKNRWKRINHRMLVDVLSKALDTEDLYIDCTCPDFCLVGDTKIKLLNGNIVTAAEMLQMYKNNEELWVYSTDENGDFKPGKVNDVWITGYASELIKVTLDNGREIITTPNHRYMLRNGEYLEASKLTEGQSLMPLYFSYHEGYESVKLNTKVKSFVSVYKTVANTLLQEDIEKAKIRSGEDVISIHHKDFNKLNNYPSNLYPMGHQEHWMYHANYSLQDKERLNKWINAGIEYWSTPEARKRKSEEMHNTMTKYWGNMTEEERLIHNKQSHMWQQTIEARKKSSENMKNYWCNLDKDTRQKRAEQANIILNGENGEKASKRTKNYWANLTPEQYKWHCEQNRKNAANTPVTENCIRARRENGKKRAKQKLIDNAMKIINKLLELNLPITEENYNNHREKGYPYYNTAMKLGILENFNHKVKKIETIILEESIPVYDISVEKYNNFYVDAGVILHNCYRFAYWATQADCKYGLQQNRPPTVRNVKNNHGYCCKHILAVLYGKRWVPAAAKSWLDFIRANPELSEWYIWGTEMNSETDEDNEE